MNAAPCEALFPSFNQRVDGLIRPTATILVAALPGFLHRNTPPPYAVAFMGQASGNDRSQPPQLHNSKQRPQPRCPAGGPGRLRIARNKITPTFFKHQKNRFPLVSSRGEELFFGCADDNLKAIMSFRLEIGAYRRDGSEGGLEGLSARRVSGAPARRWVASKTPPDNRRNSPPHYVPAPRNFNLRPTGHLRSHNLLSPLSPSPASHRLASRSL